MFPISRCLSLFFCLIGTIQAVEEKPLHRHMTEIEIQKFFGVQTSADVPEYEIIMPYQSNEDGEFVTHALHKRYARDIHESGARFYKMDAFGNKLHLKLTRNTQLVKPGLELETRLENGDVTRTPVKSDSLFLGKEINDPDSLVAVSNDKGLTGMIKLSSETLFVHPLPDHLAKHVTTGSGAKPHLVYRKSAEPLHCETKAASNLVATGIKNDVRSDSYNPSVHKYLQAALVVDENVVAKHGNSTADFLLVLANIVAGSFRDNSIGKVKVNYVVSRIITLTNKELNLKPDSKSGEKLAKIRQWADKNKPENKSDPLYFDDISLVHVGSGGGLALAGGMCSARVTGNVNGYAGLQTAGIILHETAHNIGLGHDVDYNCSNGANIMSTYTPGGEGALKWSSCSRHVLQNFLSGPGSKCLDDPPQITLPGFNNKDIVDKLPGVVYDGDTQCEFQYGAGWRRCNTGNCAILWCTKTWGSCHSNVMPPADGTSCGPRHWCIKGKCVDNGAPRINGGWSEWSDYSSCSATCVGGVQHRQRTCTNPPPSNDGEDCLGSAKGKWKICNSQTECPSPSYRDLQCKKVKPGTRAYYVNKYPCELACITSGLEVTFQDLVRDGERCTKRPDNLDVCIAGKCRPVGCDHVLESGVRKDRCGICGGNGETCLLVNSSYTKVDLDLGLKTDNVMAVLPVGTANARFKQRKEGYDALGIKDHVTGQYIIKLPSWSKEVYYKGTRIEYHHEDNQFADSIVVDGPTKVPLRMTFVYFYERNKGGVDFQYYRPIWSNETAQSVSSKWVTGEWSACPVKCGQGVITRDVSCVRSDDGTPASAQSCSAIVKPQSRKSCNMQSCTPEWHLTDWNECSKTCGNGSHSRLLYCRKQIKESYYEKLDESVCEGIAKPIGSEPLFQRCNEVPCPAEWRTLPWSECSKTCGGGLVTRKLECIRTDEQGHVIPAAKELCRYAMKPLTEAICNDDKPCDPPPEIQVACFIGADNLEEVLGDFTKEIKWDNTNEVVKKCAKLAHAKDYKLFALGQNGLCLSGPDTRRKYYVSGTYGAYCRDGIGMGKSMFVYTLEHLPSLQPVGCYHDSQDDRALLDNYAIFRDQIIWTKMELTVNQCARVAYDKGYEYFAIQFYGECWGGKDAGKNYAKYGKSEDCWKFDKQSGHSVGGELANFVYKIKQDMASAALK